MQYKILVNKDDPYAYEFPELGMTVTIDSKDAAKYDVTQLASTALLSAFNDLRKSKKKIPLPDGTGGAYVPLVIQMKIHLWNWMIDNRFRGTDITERMGWSRQNTYHFLNFGYPCSTDLVAQVCDALGAQISVSVTTK